MPCEVTCGRSKSLSGDPEQGRAGSCCGSAPGDPRRGLPTHTSPTTGKGPPEPLSFPLHLQGQTLNNWNITVMAAAVEASVIPDFYLFYWRSSNKYFQCTYWTVQMSAITLCLMAHQKFYVNLVVYHPLHLFLLKKGSVFLLDYPIDKENHREADQSN